MWRFLTVKKLLVKSEENAAIINMTEGRKRGAGKKLPHFIFHQAQTSFTKLKWKLQSAADEQLWIDLINPTR